MTPEGGGGGDYNLHASHSKGSKVKLSPPIMYSIFCSAVSQLFSVL